MAAKPVFGIPIEPWPFGGEAVPQPGLVDGEHVLTFGPPFEGVYSVANGTYHLSRRMRFEGGVYQVRALADDAATWWIGPSLGARQVVFNHTLGQGVVTGEFYVPPGTMRLDIVVENLPAEPTPSYVAFSLWRDGELVYVSTPEGWVWDTNPIADSDLPVIEKVPLPVWTVLPNWQGGITERLSWLTDIMESETGAEQRRALRPHPRRSIEASFLREGANRSRLDMFLAGVGQHEFLLPLWHEQVKMPNGITLGATGVALGANGTQHREFRSRDIVFVNNGDPNDYDLLEVAEVESDRFGWATPPRRDWPPGTRIFPCRIARIIEPPQLTNLSGRVATLQVRFELVEPDVRTPAWGEYVDDVPFFSFRPDWKRAVDLDYTRKSYLLDNQASLVQIADWSNEARVGMRLGLTLFGRSQVFAFRQMLAAARGRAARFYIPSYTEDVRVASDIAGGTQYLDVEPMGFTDAMATSQPTRRMLRIEATGRAPVYRRILTAAPVYDVVKRAYVVRYASLHNPDLEEPEKHNGVFHADSDERLYTPGSGLNLLVFDGRTGEPIWHRAFEIAGEFNQMRPEDYEARNDLIDALNGLSADRVLILYSSGHFNGGAAPFDQIFSDGLVAAIERCGGTDTYLRDFKTCAGYMLLGVPGIGRGKGLELYSGDIDYPVDAAFEYTVNLHNGRPIAIEGAAPASVVAERFTLDSPLPAMPKHEVGRISFISEARLDQDTVELFHRTAGSRGVEVTLAIRQFHNRRSEG